MYNWLTTQTEQSLNYILLTTDTDEKLVKKSIEASTEKAIGLLKENIQDDSLYLLFEWDKLTCTLCIIVTDATKTHDCPAIIKNHFPTLKSNFAALASDEKKSRCDELTDSIQFWLHDYLTTCNSFFHYSLVAIFHSDTRGNTVLL